VKSSTDISIARLRGPLLRSVSRSFYLSLRLLPARLRDPISLAYLLARATDTVADTPLPDSALRVELLRGLALAIQNPSRREIAAHLEKYFAPMQRNKADRIEVQTVLAKINQGQMLDLERFGISSQGALNNSAELDGYTYLVAGCVGEFWTRLCFFHVTDFSDRALPEMETIGIHYGNGLQLTNILRDAGSDLRAGRCYLPADELQSLGLTAAEVLSQPSRAEPILRRWLEKAETGIAAGIDYACAIRSPRIRLASALPALIGARTLALLREAGPGLLEHRIKVPRREVRNIVATSAITLASKDFLRRTFRRLSSGGSG
jgi:farnesyl-diphosphate farnesyltransferase